MSVYAIVAVGLLALVVGFWFWGRQPYRHRRLTEDDIERHLRTLLKHGYDGGLLTFELGNRRRHLGRFLQFSKHVKRGGIAGIEFGFPEAPWSRDIYPRFRDALAAADIPFVEESTFRDDTKRFLGIDLGKDINRAREIVSIASKHVFEMGPGDTLEAYFRNVSPRDEQIGN